MIKRRILGAAIMVSATVLGVYGGLWHLFLKSIMELWGLVDNVLETTVIIVDVIKIFILFPMSMVFVLFLLVIGKMIFGDN